MKTLIFEGAGWEKADSSINSGVGNCRIRTRIRNNAGRIIYLELGGFEVSKNEKRETHKHLNIAGHIDYCFYDDATWDSKSNYSKEFSDILKVIFEYNKENIIKLVNQSLNCSFDSLEVINDSTFCVYNTNEPLCDCSNGDYEPYKDIKININVLDGIQPTLDYRDRGFSQYRINYELLKSFKYINKWIQERTEREQEQFNNYHYCAILRWNTEGIITSLELSARENFCNFSMGAEDLQVVIDEIKKCSLAMAV
jgi:hypothetical protein